MRADGSTNHTAPASGAIAAWWGTLAVCVMAVSLLTAAVMTLSLRRTESAQIDLPEVPERIDGREVHPDIGRQLFMQNCASCHGVDATGMPRQGANLSDSVFVRRRADEQLLSFLRVGRLPGERETVLNLTMPPRGGNASLEDAELADIVAYLRLVQQQRAAMRDRTADSGVRVIGAAPGRL